MTLGKLFTNHGMMAAVPTNEQRRATAKRKSERQQERRAKQARGRRILVIGAGTVVVIGLITALILVLTNDKDDHKSKSSAATSTTGAPGSTSTASAPTSETTPSAPPLPAFQPSSSVGANCHYAATPDKPAKSTNLPRSGKVPTDEKTVSVSMVTNQGNIGLLLANNESPCTVNSFVSLTEQGFFNNTKCHRLTTSSSLHVLQCGDPNGDGTGGPGYEFANEYPTTQYPSNDPKAKQAVLYPRGTLAMANAGPNTNGSQFFLVYGDSELPPQYTVFGTIQADGLTTLDKIAQGGVSGGSEDGAPASDVTIKSVQMD
jgi:peptidyl-prolyl cis-trans isomerase B (cyclophilin B)